MDGWTIRALSEIKTRSLWRPESNFRDTRPQMFKSHEIKTVPGKSGRKEFIRYDNPQIPHSFCFISALTFAQMCVLQFTLLRPSEIWNERSRCSPYSWERKCRHLTLGIPHTCLHDIRCDLIASYERVLASSVHCKVRFDGKNSLTLFWQSPWRENNYDE